MDTLSTVQEPHLDCKPRLALITIAQLAIQTEQGQTNRQTDRKTDRSDPAQQNSITLTVKLLWSWS